MILDLKMANAALAAKARLIRKRERANNKKFQKVRDQARVLARMQGLPGEDVSKVVANAIPKDHLQYGSHLQSLRCGQTRKEAREHFLAYGFLRKRPYHVIENKTRSIPDFSEVVDLAFQYGRTRMDQKEPVEVQEIAQHFSEWLDAAKDYLKSQDLPVEPSF